jgi:hypothetical protein
MTTTILPPPFSVAASTNNGLALVRPSSPRLRPGGACGEHPSSLPPRLVRVHGALRPRRRRSQLNSDDGPPIAGVDAEP